MRSILLSLVLGVTIPVVLYSGYLMTQKDEPQALSGFGDPFVSIQLATSPSNGDCLTTDGTNNAWDTCGAGGSSKWTDATTYIYPTGGLYASFPFAIGTSTTVASVFPMLSASSSAITYASSTAITATNFWGTASLATALGANGSNCSAGNSPLGVDASGAVESCFDVWTEAENTSASYLSSVDISANTNLSVTATGLTLSGDAIVLTAGYEIPTTTRMNVWDSKGNGTVTSVAMTVPTGLAISGSPITTSGTLALTLDTGYQIPTTTRMITWDTAYGWGNHASAGYLTGNQTITLSGDVTGSGATSITTAVADDSHAHTGTTLSGIDISDDTNLSADGTEIVLTGDALSLGTNLTFTNATSTASFFSALGTFTNSVINTLLTAVSGVFTSSLQIPNSSDPTVDASGEIAVNTSTSSLRFHDNTAERQIKSEWSWGATLASSSLAYDGAFDSGGTTTIQKVGFKYGVTHSEYYCRTNVGNVTIVVGDGTASSSPIRCSATGTADSTASNGSFTAREMILISVGSSDNNSSLTDIYFDATARWTTD